MGELGSPTGTDRNFDPPQRERNIAAQATTHYRGESGGLWDDIGYLLEQIEHWRAKAQVVLAAVAVRDGLIADLLDAVKDARRFAIERNSEGEAIGWALSVALSEELDVKLKAVQDKVAEAFKGAFSG